MSEKLKGYISAILYTTFIGLSFLFSKIALINGNALDILAQRFTIAFIVICPIVYFKRNKLNLDKSQILKLLPIGFVSPVLFFSFQILGLSHVSSTEAGVLQSIVPIIILILSVIFLKEKISFLQILFTIISVSAVIFIITVNNNGGVKFNFLGLGLMILSNLCFAIFTILIKKFSVKYTVLQITFINTFTGFIVFNLMAIVQHIFNKNLNGYLDPLKNFNYVFALLYLGIISTLGTSFLSNYAISKIKASVMGLFGNLSTLVTIFAGVIILKESFTTVQVIAMIVIIISVISANMVANKK